MPLVTILTDMADYPPHFWIERQPQYLICGTEKAYRQALAAGHLQSRVFLTSGMILNPRYYEPVGVDRVRDREALGLDPELPTDPHDVRRRGLRQDAGYCAPPE